MERALGAGRRPTGRAQRRGAARRERARILLVDDARSVRESMAELLRGAGYEVSVADGGPVALGMLERDRVDLVLTDVCMPEMSGWDLARAVRGRRITAPGGHPLCVGIYSAVLGAVGREQLARAGVDFALTKLSDAGALLDAIERNLAWAEACA